MCGLVGAAGSMNDQDRKAMKWLLLFDATRGEDSTGLAYIDRASGDIGLVKEVGHAANLIYGYDCFDDKGVIKGAHSVLLGHNRWATRGKVIEANAHPFWHGKIIGAHNGTLTSVSKLEDGHKFDVDSEAIFFNIDKHGHLDTIPKIQGAYALTWYNSDEKKVYLTRNKERPLYYTRRKDRDVFFWASEQWMLSIALGRSNIQFDEIKELPVDHIFSLNVADVSFKAIREVELVNEGELKGYVPPPTPVRVYDYSGSYWNDNESWTPGIQNRNIHKSSQGSQGGSNTWPHSNRQNKNFSNHTDLDWENVKKMEGKTIEFYTQGEETGMTSLKYLQAFPVEQRNDNLRVEIRLYGAHSPQYANWLKLLTTWRGKVRKAVSHTGPGGRLEVYLTMDLRTIEEVLVSDKVIAEAKEINKRAAAKEEAATSNIVPFQGKHSDRIPFDPDIIPEWFEGYRGARLSKDDWDTATRKGCTWCQASVGYTDKIVFIDHQECVCELCSEDPEVVEYLGATFH